MEVQSALKTKEIQKTNQTHKDAGLRFTLLKYFNINVQYLSFNEVNLKDDTHLEVSGFSVVSGGEGVVSEDFPTVPGFCRVGGALFMVGGMYNEPEVGPTKWLWSAPPPPIPDGSFTMTWTRCDTAMDSERFNNLVVPLHDGRIFICGGTCEPKCWIEIYDPENGEFDRRDLPDHISNPFPASCFLLADQLVMLYYHNGVNKEEVVRPSLVLYDVGRNTWEIFAENLPVHEAHGLLEMEKRNLIYVGGNILFIIDQASRWFVYDLSAKKEVGKVDVRIKDGDAMQAFYLGNNDMISSSWMFYIFLPNENYYHTYTDLRYAKVEVVQGKGGDYIATVQLSGLLRVGDHDELYIFIADEVSSKRGAEEDLLEVKEEDEK
ncbi:hypothetical protein AAHA92_33452 [Salvia divinorum]|uniref:Uncharacterized protein n=1 Tax=Salvia divinorum TaxID=28513 RepID=A0ABD1FP23_SALDI